MSGRAMSGDWVVLLEAAVDADGAPIDGPLVDRLIERVDDCEPSVLYVADRLALQLRVAAAGPLDALVEALDRWREAAAQAQTPPLEIQRVEILTREELEQDWSSGDGREFAVRVDPHPRSPQDDLADRLLRRAFHDEETGLPNAALFAGFIDAALGRDPGEARHAVLLVEVGDARATPTGRVARQLAEVTRPRDTRARLGDHTFGVLVEDVTEREMVAIGRRLLSALAEPGAVGDGGAAVGASIGMALSGSGNAEGLLADAAAALRAARAAGGGQCQLFRSGMPARLSRRSR